MISFLMAITSCSDKQSGSNDWTRLNLNGKVKSMVTAHYTAQTDGMGNILSKFPSNMGGPILDQIGNGEIRFNEEGNIYFYSNTTLNIEVEKEYSDGKLESTSIKSGMIPNFYIAEYDDAGNLISYGDEYGEHKNEYDSNGVLVSSTLESQTYPVSKDVTRYDANGRIVSQSRFKDFGNGRTSQQEATVAYDEKGNFLSETFTSGYSSKEITEVEYKAFDEQGNWTERLVKSYRLRDGIEDNISYSFETRQISYY